jgi:hypothetical protein
MGAAITPPISKAITKFHSKLSQPNLQKPSYLQVTPQHTGIEKGTNFLYNETP